jgi:hypothetical protein
MRIILTRVAVYNQKVLMQGQVDVLVQHLTNSTDEERVRQVGILNLIPITKRAFLNTTLQQSTYFQQLQDRSPAFVSTLQEGIQPGSSDWRMSSSDVAFMVNQLPVVAKFLRDNVGLEWLTKPNDTPHPSIITNKMIDVMAGPADVTLGVGERLLRRVKEIIKVIGGIMLTVMAFTAIESLAEKLGAPNIGFFTRIMEAFAIVGDSLLNTMRTASNIWDRALQSMRKWAESAFDAADLTPEALDAVRVQAQRVIKSIGDYGACPIRPDEASLAQTIDTSADNFKRKRKQLAKLKETLMSSTGLIITEEERELFSFLDTTFESVSYLYQIQNYTTNDARLLHHNTDWDPSTCQWMATDTREELPSWGQEAYHAHKFSQAVSKLVADSGRRWKGNFWSDTHTSTNIPFEDIIYHIPTIGDVSKTLNVKGQVTLLAKSRKIQQEQNITNELAAATVVSGLAIVYGLYTYATKRNRLKRDARAHG